MKPIGCASQSATSSGVSGGLPVTIDPLTTKTITITFSYNTSILPSDKTLNSILNFYEYYFNIKSEKNQYFFNFYRKILFSSVYDVFHNALGNFLIMRRTH